jgi:hypothetical protein
MTTPKQTGVKLCRCGCGERVTPPKHYTPACKAVVRANRYNSRAPRVHVAAFKLGSDAPRPKRKLCQHCFDTALPHRQAGTCPSCGRTYEADLVEAAE